MAFIDTSDTIIGVAIAQIDARYIEPGQPVEVTFKYLARARSIGGKVESVLQAIATGQVQVSGLAVAPKEVASAPFVVRIRLDDTGTRAAPAGRQHRRRCDLHRSRQAGSHHPQGAAAPDRDHQLHQPVLTGYAALPRRSRGS